MNATRIQLLVRGLIIVMLENSLTFEEGIIASRVLTFMMEEIKRDGNIDEDFLSEIATRLVRDEIAKGV